MRKDAPLSELIDILRQEDSDHLNSTSSSQSLNSSPFLATRVTETTVCAKPLPLSEPKTNHKALATSKILQIDQENPAGSSAYTDSDASHTPISPAVLSIDTNASSMLQEYERFDVQTSLKYGKEVLRDQSPVPANYNASATSSDSAQTSGSTFLVASHVGEFDKQLKSNNQKSIFNQETFLFTPDSTQDLSLWG